MAHHREGWDMTLEKTKISNNKEKAIFFSGTYVEDLSQIWM